MSDPGPAREAASVEPADATADPSLDRLVWIDLEMTGLDLDQHTIVEIAVVVTDSRLELVDAGIDLVVHQPPEVLAAMDDFVTQMHTKSGLLDAIRSSTLSLDEAGKQSLAYIERYVPTARAAPVCGNSIGVDRRFLDRYLPEIDAYLHYRSIDVSSFKEVCRRWNPAVFRRRPGKKEAHRALDDILESLEELRYYRDHFLRLPEPATTAEVTPPPP